MIKTTPLPVSEEKQSMGLLDGRAVAAAIRADVATQVEDFVSATGRRPGLVAVLVGADTASRTYVESKTRACREVGMVGQVVNLPAAIEQSDLEREIERLNLDPTVDGFIVQLPLPKHLDERRITEHVDPAKDVDGFHPENVGKLWLDRQGFAPATPAGIIELLKRSKIELKGRHAVVVGRSAIVGKPMAGLLLRESCTVTICHSQTADLAAQTRRAEILIAAVGRAGMIGPEHVGDGAVVIDVGINRVDDRATVERLFPGDEERWRSFEKKGYVLTGDVDFERVRPKASWITPVPGGVGPLTVAQLLANTLVAARRRAGLL